MSKKYSVTCPTCLGAECSDCNYEGCYWVTWSELVEGQIITGIILVVLTFLVIFFFWVLESFK